MTLQQRRWAVPTYIGLAAMAALALLAPGLVARIEWLPLLVSLPLFGMAHGAVDHHVPGRLLRRPLSHRERGLLIAVYSAVSILLMALWWVAPLVALGMFLLVAILHWGDGDLWFSEAVNGRSAPRSGISLAAFILARGLLPIAFPLLVHDGAALPVLDDLVALFGHEGALVLAPAGRALGLGVVGIVVVVAMALSLRDNAGRPARAALIDVGELLILAMFFLITPPVFAVGVYFLMWHSPRHILRLMTCNPTQRALLDAGRTAMALVAFHREALLFTIVPLIGVAGIALALAATGASQIAAVSLAAIAALTYPHAVIVGWMDHRQGVWRAG